MVSDTQQHSIQLCAQSVFLSDAIRQLYPDIVIRDETVPKMDSACNVSIVENDENKVILSYVKKFETSAESAIFIVSGDFRIPDIKSHNIFFVRKPFRINQLQQLLLPFFKKVFLQLDSCIIDEQTKALIAIGDQGAKEKIRLTNKEFDILCFIVETGGSVSKKDILQYVFGYSELSNTNTVDVHLHRLKQKISQYVDISKYIKE